MSKATRHSHTLFERLRKPVSQVAAVIFLGVLVFSAPAAGCCRYSAILFETLGWLLVIAGVFGRLWCALYIGGHKNTHLRDDGPYSISRNPLYFFSFLGLLGLTLYMRMVMLTLIVAALFVIYYYFVIRSEENRLKEIFGATFQNYLNKVPRFWPNFSLYSTRKSFEIEPAEVLKAVKDVVWFFLAIIFLGILKHLQAMGVVPSYFVWPW
jgi:protein-S-isoprenylcysteine O-methyltransferase Ste14